MSTYIELARSTRAILEAKSPGAVAVNYRVVWLDDDGRPNGAIEFNHGVGAEGLERAIRTWRTGWEDES